MRHGYSPDHDHLKRRTNVRRQEHCTTFKKSLDKDDILPSTKVDFMLINSTEHIRHFFKNKPTPRSLDLELANDASRSEAEICPITLERLDELSPHEIYTDLNDGIRYDRAALRQWFQQSAIMPHCNEERPEDRRIVLTMQPQDGSRQQVVLTRFLRLSDPLRAPNVRVLKTAVNIGRAGTLICWPMFIAAGVHWGRVRGNTRAKNVTLGSGCAVGACVGLLAFCIKMPAPENKKSAKDSFGYVGTTHAVMAILAILPTALGTVSKDEAVLSLIIAEVALFFTGSLMMAIAACGFSDVRDD